MPTPTLEQARLLHHLVSCRNAGLEWVEHVHLTKGYKPFDLSTLLTAIQHGWIICSADGEAIRLTTELIL